MAKRVENGMYDVGRVDKDGRSRRGKYVVVKGEVANQRGHIEWRPVQFLDKSKWYAVRVGPTERGTRRTNTVAHPLEEFSSKKEAVNYLMNSVDFDETY
jgi:hypothetical protein